MFRTFRGTPDAFQLACEYGPSHVRGNGKIPTPEALKSFTLDWTSAESETQVLERFAQRQSALLLEQTEERVSLQLSWEPMADASAFPNQHLTVKLCITSQAPVLRSLHFTRTAGSGCAPESLMTTLLQHMDLSTVWKLRVSEGFPAHFWASCTEAHQWHSLFNLNLSSSGLTSLPSAIGQLASLHVLRLNHNKLTSLPQELGHLSELEVLSVNHNQLTTLPAELRRCSSLRELHLEFNRLVTPLLDLTHATALESLQLYGNPLEYLPELAPAVGLRSLSLANVRIMADAAYTRWEVEVTAPSSSYTSMVMGGRNHKLQPLFNLVFRRSSVQHPLLAGAMSRLMEDPTNLELLVREDVALQQLVLASMGSNPLVVQQAVKIMSAVGAYAGAAKRLVKHNVVRAISGMVASGDKSLQLSGLRVLSSLAAGAAEGELHGEVLVPTALLDRLLALIRTPDTHQEVRCAVLHALGNSAFDVSNRRRYLQSPGLMQLLVMLAAAPDTPTPPSPPPAAAAERGQAQASPGTSSASAAAGGPSKSVQQRQEAEAEDSPAEDMGSRQQQEAAGGSSSADAAAPQPAQASGSPPLAPNPHIGQSGAAAEQAASFSPPLITMSRAPSSTGKTAAPAGEQTGSAAQDVLVLAQSSSVSGKALDRSTSGCQASGAPASSSEASGLSGPSTAMAAAAGAAAVAAAAHTTGPGDAAGEIVAASSAAAGGASGKKAGAAGGSTSSAVAAADAILPKKRLVAVNNPVKLQAIRLLGILGQNEQVRIALGQPPIRGRGLRVLAMDGGGMKGMAMVELLRQLERRAGAPIWTLFDVMGGTSTGGLLAVSLGLLRLNLDACQEIYTSLGNKVFNQSSAVQEDAGWRDNLYRMYTTSSANMRVAVYGSKHDAANYEELLRKFCAVTELGCASDRLIDTAVMGGPKVFVVATLASSRPAAPFAFRNYELPDEATPISQQLAACAGSCKHHVWEAVRASSAAPYYLDDFLTADGKRFQDGATTANNPTVIALQQARLLHPQLPIDCVVSLGCGSEPFSERSKGLSSVIDTGAVLLESACSTDRVHEALATTLQLVPGCQYFRFCAVDPRCNMELDDIRQESWSRLMTATSDYCSQPQVAAQFDRLAALLKQGGNAAPGVGAPASQEAQVGGSSSPARPQPHVTGWHPSSRPHKAAPGQADTEQQQQQARQASANPLLLGGSLLRDLACTSSLQHTSLSGPTAEEDMALQGLQQARAEGEHTSAPRLLYQRGLLLVQARREVAAPAAAAAAAQGVSLASLQQQEFVAQLLAAALPQDLVHTCDLAAASAAAAADVAAAPAANRAAWEQQSPYGQHAAAQHQQTQQQQQRRQHLRVAADAGKGIHSTELHSTETSPRHLVSRHGSIGSSQLHGGSAAAAAVAQRLQQHGGSDAGERHKVDRPQRASDTGVMSLSSPKPSSWLEYIFPWQGAASAGSSPRQQQQQSLDGSQQGGSGEAAAAAVGICPAAGGAWSSASTCDGSSPGSPRKAVSQVQEAQRRATAGARPASGNNMQAVQSSPNLLPGSITQQQQQQEVTPGGSLLKIKSLPAQYLSPQQQQQQQLATDGAIRSSSYSPSLPTLPGSSGGGSHSSRIANTGHSQAGHSAHGTGGSSAGQQQHAAAGSAAVSEALRQQLLSAAGRVGVVHLALHATEAGLVAGWQQQLTAVVEPGPEVSQLLDFLTDSCSADSSTRGHTLAQLVSSQGPLLSGPQGALVAVLAQQQVLAPLPASSNTATAAAGGLPGLGQLGAAQQMTQFVTSWLLQLTLPDSSRLLGVKQVWPLLSQLQQLIIVSSTWLPPAVVHVLLRGGVSAVVCGTDAAKVAALEAADVAEFFRVFYVEGLWAGLDVVEALQAAIAAVPSVGDTTYECYQLM